MNISSSHHSGVKWQENEQLRREWILLHELKACSNLQRGKQIHVEAIEIGISSWTYFVTALVNMFAKCRSMSDAHLAFDCIKHPDVELWTALISGYADNGEGLIALELFGRMRYQNCAPNSFTFISVLKACTSLARDHNKAECLKRGKQIHLQIGCHLNIYVQSTLIKMYSKCGSMTDARQVFEHMMHQDVVSWTALILGYAENGEGVTALDFFARMRSRGCAPNFLTFVAVLKACTSLESLKEIHSQIGCHSDMKIRNTLIDMYAKCGSMKNARRVFEGMKHPNVVSWTALISGYANNGQGTISLDLFRRMKSRGCTPNSVTFVAALKACTSLLNGSTSARVECLLRGKEIHSQVNCHINVYVQNTLIDMYAKCGSMKEARQVFECMKRQDVVSWNALILGYAENGEYVIALELFARMRLQRCAPDCLTFVAALKACGSLGAYECGKRIHAEIDTIMESDEILVNCLLDFYAKCGDMVAAKRVFDSHPGTRDLITWTTLLAGYSRLGNYKDVFELVERMVDAGIQPNGITFLCVLMCCSYSGLVDKGRECLETMSTKYGIAPTLEHYTCLVDILGRSNKLDEALELLDSMPFRPDGVAWMTVLSACRKLSWHSSP